MDTYHKQNQIIASAIPVVGCSFALAARIKKITGTLAYLRLMQLADDSGLAVGNADLELEDLERALDNFGRTMEGLSHEIKTKEGGRARV